MNRKIIILFIIFAVLAGSAVFFYAVKSQKPSDQITESLEIKKVLDEQVRSPVAAYDNNSIWYFNSKGRLFSVKTDNTGLSEFPLPSFEGSVASVLWPKTGFDFILVSLAGSKFYYDNAAKVFVNLPRNIRWIEWMPDGRRVLYVWQSDDKTTQSLAMANADGTGYRAIVSVFWPDLAVKAAPDGKTAALYRTAPESSTNKIYSVNLETGEIGTFIEDWANKGVLWLNTSNKFIFEQEQKLLLYDTASKQITDLNLNAGLNRAVLETGGARLYAKTDDAFVKVNLENLAQEIYFPSQIEVKDLVLVGGALYFTNTADGKFYTLGK